MWLFGEGFGDRHCSLEKVSSFLDSALRDREMQRVEAHLASCTGCAQQVEEMKSVVGLLRMMPTEPTPRSFAIPVPARVFVTEPARPWWRPAPMVGLRAHGNRGGDPFVAARSNGRPSRHGCRSGDCAGGRLCRRRVRRHRHANGTHPGSYAGAVYIGRRRQPYRTRATADTRPRAGARPRSGRHRRN